MAAIPKEYAQVLTDEGTLKSSLGQLALLIEKPSLPQTDTALERILTAAKGLQVVSHALQFLVPAHARTGKGAEDWRRSIHEEGCRARLDEHHEVCTCDGDYLIQTVREAFAVCLPGEKFDAPPKQG